MIEALLMRIKMKLWRKFLPLFASHGPESNEPYNYYSLFLADVENLHYRLMGYHQPDVQLGLWTPEHRDYSKNVTLTVNELAMMEVEIIHYRRQGVLSFKSIFLFAVSYYTRIAYAKNAVNRFKSKISPVFRDKKELQSLDRIMLLKILVHEFIQQRPAKTATGLTLMEVINLLYGKLWYKHIKNEEFRRKTNLLLQSLVITEELILIDDRFLVQGKAIVTIVAWENEERRITQQLKMHQNIVRLTWVITASTLIITLAILAQAGLVNLHRLWEYISQLKPLRIILKLI